MKDGNIAENYIRDVITGTTGGVNTSVEIDPQTQGKQQNGGTSRNKKTLVAKISSVLLNYFLHPTAREQFAHGKAVRKPQ